jgi:hypothetical protein
MITRVLVGATLGVFLLLTTFGLRAATPASASVSAAGDSASWTGGPFTSPLNLSTATCVDAVTCDRFTLELRIPEGKVATVRFRLDWASSGDDFDLYVRNAAGATFGFSEQGNTNFEQTVVADMPPGTYTVLVNAFSTVNAAYAGQLVVESVGDPDPASFKETPRIEFGADTIVDFSAVSGEPVVRVNARDEIFVTVPFGLSTTVSLLWKSIDGGRTFIPLGTPIARDSVTSPGGGDSHVDFDAAGRLYFVDLSGACVTAAVSLDGGNTFPPDRTNPVVCVSLENPQAVQDDRQWVGAFGDGIGYATWRNLILQPAQNFWLFKTSNGGVTWDAGRSLGRVSQSGPFQVDKTRRTVTVDGAARQAILSYQVYYRGTELRVFRITDFHDGSPMRIEDFLVVDPGVGVDNVFPQLAIDREGNVYAGWSQQAATIFVASSTDRGATWSAPVRVSTTSGTNIMPWVVAGDPGRINVVWYRSPIKGNRDVPESEWDILLAQSLNALDRKPRFSTARVNQTVIHRGEICLRGLNCDLDGSDRSFLEFPSVDIDSRGAALVAFNDNTNQVAAPYVMVSTQVAGPSLFKSVNVLSGTNADHRTSDADESGDARFPNHGAVIGDNVAALDIRSVSLQDDADTITISLDVADLTTQALAAAPARSGGDGVLYLVQWDHNDDVRWVAAEVRGSAPAFLTGTLGSIDTLGPKFITYRPDLTASGAVRGRIVAGAPGRIEVTVPRSLVGSPNDGDSLFTVTAYAFSERGPLAPEEEVDAVDSTSLPVQVDATGAFRYLVGTR